MKIKHIRSKEYGNTPSNLEHGEIAINYNDKSPKLFIKTDENVVEEFSSDKEIKGYIDNNIDALAENLENAIICQETNDVLDEVDTIKFLKYVEQYLTEEEKKQSRTNIGATDEEWVISQGYLTEHQDISNLSTKDEVSALQITVEGEIDSIQENVNNLTDGLNIVSAVMHSHENKLVIDDIDNDDITRWNSTQPNIIESISVNNTPLTISDKNVNIDLAYIEDQLSALTLNVENIELTPGPQGIGITSIDRTNGNGAAGTTDTYTITYSDDSKSTFKVYNGKNGADGKNGVTPEFISINANADSGTGVPYVSVISAKTNDDKYTLLFNFQNIKGVGITSVDRTNGNGAAGTTDVYTITYSDGTKSTFNVYNGNDGQDGKPGDDGENGVTPEFISINANADSGTGIPYVSVISAKTNDDKYTLSFNFQNIKGEKGDTGDKGDKGDKGEDGTSVKILGSKNSFAELPLTNNANGDGYIIGENLYVWNGSTWQDVGKVKGPQGEPGTNAYITGVTANVSPTTGTPSVKVTSAGTPSNISFNLSFDGLKGEPGEDGKNGIGIKSFVKTSGDSASGTTDVYTITFTNGVTSAITVYNGTNGEDGANGNMWHVGTGVPLTTLGVAGDLYLEGIVGTVYQKRDGDYWLPTDCNLRGNDGKDGTNGAKWYNGTTSPDETIGANGDWYVNTSTWDVFYKESNNWVKKGCIKGETGSFENIDLNDYAKTSDVNKKQDAISDLTTIRNNASSGATAYGWGDHSKKGYLTSSALSGYAKEDWVTSYVVSAVTGGQVSLDGYATEEYVTSKGYITAQEISNLATKSEVEALTADVVESEYVMATALNKVIVSAGFDVNGMSTLPSGETLTNAIKRLDNACANATSDLASYLSKSGGQINGSLIINDESHNHITLTDDGEMYYDAKISYSDGTLGVYSGNRIDILSPISVKSKITVSNEYSGFTCTNLNADLLDGKHASEFMLKTDSVTGSVTYDDITDAPLIDNNDGEFHLVDENNYKIASFNNGGLFTTKVTAINGFFQNSDETLKEFKNDIEIDFERLKNIPKVYYTWKDDTEENLQIGTSAQKVQEIYPELTSRDADSGKLALDYAKLSIIALKAIDTLHEENKLLRKELEELKEKVNTKRTRKKKTE